MRGQFLVILSTSLELALIPPQDEIKLWAVWSLFQCVALRGMLLQEPHVNRPRSPSSARTAGRHSSASPREERASGEAHNTCTQKRDEQAGCSDPALRQPPPPQSTPENELYIFHLAAGYGTTEMFTWLTGCYPHLGGVVPLLPSSKVSGTRAEIASKGCHTLETSLSSKS